MGRRKRYSTDNFANMQLIGMVVHKYELKEGRQKKYLIFFVAYDHPAFHGKHPTPEEKMKKSVCFRFSAFGDLAEYIDANYEVGDLIFITGAEPQRTKFRDSRGRWKDEIQWVANELNVEEVE